MFGLPFEECRNECPVFWLARESKGMAAFLGLPGMTEVWLLAMIHVLGLPPRKAQLFSDPGRKKREPFSGKTGFI